MIAWIAQLIAIVLVTAATLFAVTKLPLGVEIDRPKDLLITAAAIGGLNAILDPLLPAAFDATNPATLFFLALFFNALVNALIFSTAALLIEGFRLRNSFWSAVWGAIAIGGINAWILRLFPNG